MKLWIKQKAFSWNTSYEVFDEKGTLKYIVRTESGPTCHVIHIYDAQQKEVASSQEKEKTTLPVFELKLAGRYQGKVEKKFSFFQSKYDVDFCGWHVEGNFLEWKYDVYEACSAVIHVCENVISSGNVYMLEFVEQVNEVAGLLLVATIAAANTM